MFCCAINIVVISKFKKKRCFAAANLAKPQKINCHVCDVLTAVCGIVLLEM